MKGSRAWLAPSYILSIERPASCWAKTHNKTAWIRAKGTPAWQAGLGRLRWVIRNHLTRLQPQLPNFIFGQRPF
jgi:hypothetical protein